jgi:cysteine synthase A
MIAVPDARSIAAMHWVREVTGRDVGGSTGTNVAACVELIKEMRQAGLRGSVVTLICDSGDRYRGTYGDPAWLSAQGLHIEPHLEELRAFLPL